MSGLKGILGWINCAESSEVEDPIQDTVLFPADDDTEPVVVDAALQSRFRPVRELGRGAMCSVHETEDMQLLRRSALKVMHPFVAAEPAMRQQFVVEARITAQLDHPNIAPIYEFGHDSERVPYIAMRKVSGETLETVISTDPRQRLLTENLKRVVRILIRVCEALAYAHSRGVVHRDVKPSNIMVGDFDEVYLVDWGVAVCLPDLAEGDPIRTTVDGLVVQDSEGTAGSPSYMAPEQVQGSTHTVSVRTDVFLLGATLYHALAGRPPYPGESNLATVLRKVAACDYPRLGGAAGDPSLPSGLVRIVERAMSADPAKRYATVCEMHAALRQYLEGSGLFSQEHHAAGSLVIREGDPGDRAYIIREGTCRVFFEHQGVPRPIRTMGAGEVFGEMAILSDGVRTASVEAVTDVVLEVVSRETLIGGFDEQSPTRLFVRALAERFMELEHHTRRSNSRPPAGPDDPSR